MPSKVPELKSSNQPPGARPPQLPLRLPQLWQMFRDPTGGGTAPGTPPRELGTAPPE